MSSANIANVAVHWSCFACAEQPYLDSLQLLIQRLVRGKVPVTLLTADASDAAIRTMTSLQLPDTILQLGLAPESLPQSCVLLHLHCCNPATLVSLQHLAISWPISPRFPAQHPAKHPKDVIRHIIDSWSQHPDIFIVGYVMKPSRERDLAAMGMFPIVPMFPKDSQRAKPTIFHPLDLDQPLEAQLPFHVLLHKASDELLYTPDSLDTPTFSPRIQHITTFLAHHPHVCIVDPLASTSRLINRAEIATVLNTLPALPTRIPVRPPKYHITPSFTAPNLPAHLTSTALTPPYIIKPLVACGVADSHQMALVLSDRALPSLSIPVPAVIQEYVNHGGLQYKVYVMGAHVTYTTRPSIPDIHLPDQHAAATADIATLYHNFDSLKSLPKQLPSTLATAPSVPAAACFGTGAAAGPVRGSPSAAAADSEAEANEGTGPGRPEVPASASGQQGVLDQGVLEVVAAHLRKQLQLTLFGFDVVVDGGSGEWLVIDVNYFPNYREVKDAPRHFQAALQTAFDAYCH